MTRRSGLDPRRRSWDMTVNVDAQTVNGTLKLATVDWDGERHMTIACDEGPAGRRPRFRSDAADVLAF